MAPYLSMFKKSRALTCGLGSCRIALMSQGNGNGDVFTPLFVSSWRSVLDQAVKLHGCAVPRAVGQRSQGGFVSLLCRSLHYDHDYPAV